MHALGIHHEMIREDRNESVWINFPAISDYANTPEVDKIQSKFTFVIIEKLDGFVCKYPCRESYIEIKYKKDKTATGARLCCGSRLMPIVITADSDTDILFMKEGKGFARIRYQSVLKPSIEASNCKEVRESILDLQSHPHASGLKNYVDQKESEPVHGPYFGFISDGDKKLLVNGRYYVQKWGCIDPPDKGCGYILELFCRKVEGYNESNWYWLNPKYEWILISSISCHPQKDTEFNKK
uniref:Metalloendopeptidase n=1 Tax=Meloidogyne hapla TaxID=6305 RepID=A0A1I8BFA6_MELHA